MLRKLRKIFDILMYPDELTWEEEIPIYDWIKTINEKIDRIEDNQVYLRAEVLALEKKTNRLYNK